MPVGTVQARSRAEILGRDSLWSLGSLVDTRWVRALPCVARFPFAIQNRVDTQRRPLALEPVGFDQTRLTPEAQAFEQTLYRSVAVVGLGEDSMHALLLE